MMNDINKVFVVDDDDAVRDSLSMLLEAAGYTVATFSGANNFLDACTPDTVGCIILDVNMPDMDGPTLQGELARRGLLLPIIFLSGQGTIPLTVRTIKAGAIDFLTKPVEGAVLLARVQEALQRCSLLQNQARVSQSVSARLAMLTEREREVMILAVDGHTSKEIAERLDISYRTVEIHRAHVMQKTGASNMLELARITALQAPQ
ncbi:MAG: response regulator [Gallionella sp.]|jgi:FixJ family two-component response regulator